MTYNEINKRINLQRPKFKHVQTHSNTSNLHTLVCRHIIFTHSPMLFSTFSLPLVLMLIATGRREEPCAAHSQRDILFSAAWNQSNTFLYHLSPTDSHHEALNKKNLHVYFPAWAIRVQIQSKYRTDSRQKSERVTLFTQSSVKTSSLSFHPHLYYFLTSIYLHRSTKGKWNKWN